MVFPGASGRNLVIIKKSHFEESEKIETRLGKTPGCPHFVLKPCINYLRFNFEHQEQKKSFKKDKATLHVISKKYEDMLQYAVTVKTITSRSKVCPSD